MKCALLCRSGFLFIYKCTFQLSRDVDEPAKQAPLFGNDVIIPLLLLLPITMSSTKHIQAKESMF